MSKLMICMADGCEEVEALSVVDLVRRAKIEMDMVSVNGKDSIQSSHNVVICVDKKAEEVDVNAYDGVVLPGGMPGTNHLKESAFVGETVKKFYEEGKLVAAICAAPTVLGHVGILQGKKATCYPGMEDGLTGAEKLTDPVVVDQNIITSRGLGTAIPFGLEIVSYLTDEDTAKALAEKIVFFPKH